MTVSGNEAHVSDEPIVDDSTYDLLQALVSKLEAIEAYGMYREDPGGELFGSLIEDEREHARRLLVALKERLAA